MSRRTFTVDRYKVIKRLLAAGRERSREHYSVCAAWSCKFAMVCAALGISPKLWPTRCGWRRSTE
jgi:hypothetical protein